VPRLDDLSEYGHLHTGSIAATLEPGGSDVVAVATRMKEHGTVSYDPNIRPALMNSPEAVVDRVELLVGLSDVVKASDEDLGWLYPGEPVEDIMRRWVRTGPAMVVVTRGPWGAYALLANNRDMLHLDQMAVAVGDTVGAGDSFMAGLVSGLLDAGFLGSADARRRLRDVDWSAVQPALHRAVVTSALTVSRSGAYAPTMAEVLAAQEADPSLK
jgi:fructokinase